MQSLRTQSACFACGAYHAVAADERKWRVARNYTFLQRVELRRLDARGRAKLPEVQTYDVTLQAESAPRVLWQWLCTNHNRSPPSIVTLLPTPTGPAPSTTEKKIT